MNHQRSTSVNGADRPASIAAWPGYQAIAPPVPTYPIASSDASSRSTSAYSIFNDAAAPLLSKDIHMPVFSSERPEVAKKSPPFHFRLPSDQLQIIVKAITSNQQQQQGAIAAAASPNTTMPPPPLPVHAVQPKATNSSEQHGACSFPLARPNPDSDMLDVINRREQSRYSDISMHAGCTDFPSCTSEDAEGRIVHNTLTSPAEVVKGRKEGSSPAKRKLSVSYVVAKEDDHTEKRPCRSPRLLQHDPRHGVVGASISSGNDGTPRQHTHCAAASEEGLSNAIIVKSTARSESEQC